MIRSCITSALIFTVAGLASGADSLQDLQQQKQALAEEESALNSLAARLQQQTATLKSDSADVKRQKEPLLQQKGQLEQQAQEVKVIGQNLDAELQAIESRKRSSHSPAEVAVVNHMIDQYNAKVRQHRSSLQALKQAEDRHNDLARSFRAAVDRLSTGYQNHESAVNDYKRRLTAHEQNESRYTIKVNAYMASRKAPSATSTPATASSQNSTSKPNGKVFFEDTVAKTGNKK